MKRILVALDSSERAPGVLAAALRLAELTDVKLVVFRAHGDLERLVEGLPRDRIEKIITTFATPWDGICTAGREQDADLIVLGSHHYSRLDQLLGTNAGKVVNRADRNVLVVRTVL